MGMFGKRSEELLTAAADAFDDGVDPFSEHWLIEHRVTLHECYLLGEQLAILVRGFLRSPEFAQHGIALCGTNEDATMPAATLWAAAQDIEQRQRLREITAELKGMNGHV